MPWKAPAEAEWTEEVGVLKTANRPKVSSKLHQNKSGLVYFLSSLLLISMMFTTAKVMTSANWPS